eukprot:SAG31_NODE_3474_length_4233_cov_5.560716_8_plen_63_part_00
MKYHIYDTTKMYGTLGPRIKNPSLRRNFRVLRNCRVLPTGTAEYMEHAAPAYRCIIASFIHL